MYDITRLAGYELIWYMICEDKTVKEAARHFKLTESAALKQLQNLRNKVGLKTNMSLAVHVSNSALFSNYLIGVDYESCTKN